VIWVLLAACTLPVDPDEQPPEGSEIDIQPPEVVDATLACDLEEATWTITLSVAGWAGRVRSWWTADGAYVEDHLVGSQSFAPDGTGQDFLLTLSITPDFRLVEEGSATALSCGADPSVLLAIDDLDGDLYDCVVFEAQGIDWSTIDGVAPCSFE